MDGTPAPELVDRFRRDLGTLAAGGGRIGVAVSGGSDSLALLLLAAAACPGRVEAATVDHGLRAEAAAEAAGVARLCGALGVAHATLAGPLDGAGSLQMRARSLRHRLLDAWARARGLVAVLLGHHRDDQAETVLLRLARGSGVAGLGAMRPMRGTAPAIVRPLLRWRRAELAAIVAAAGLTAVDDPANRDLRHDRTRARALLDSTGWLAPERLTAAADHLRDADDALAWAAARAWSERARIGETALAIEVEGLPRELRLRLLVRAVGLLSPADPPRADRIARLLDRLDRGEPGTVGAVRAMPGRPWRLSPAPPRRRG